MEKKEGNEPDTSTTVTPQTVARERLEAIADKENVEELAKLASARNLASSKDMIGYANQRKKLELPTIGYHVYYCPLRIEDRLKINEITDDNPEIQRDQRNREKVFLLLNRADSDFWTREMVYELAAVLIDAILYEYDDAEDTRFLLPIIRRKSDTLRRTLTSRS